MKRQKRFMAMFLALLVTATSIVPNGMVQAAESEENGEYSVYDAEARTDLDADEVVKAEDISTTTDDEFKIAEDFTGISYQADKVSVQYYSQKGDFNPKKAGNYDTYYLAEPISGKRAYLIHRTITVKESESSAVGKKSVTENGEDSGSDDAEDGSDTSEDGFSKTLDEEAYPLAEGEITSMKTMSIRNSVSLKSASADSGDKMKVSYSGYAKYCGHSIGIKYISESGDYYHRSVFCMDMNKNTTSGTVTVGKKVKAKITYALVNGVRTYGGRCHNSDYQGGSAAEDYFITSAAIHVLNGEVSLKYYNNGSSTYKKIASLVSDAKNCNKSKYDSETGRTKSITYTLSPNHTEWKKVSDGLYRTADKIVREKSGTVTDVKYAFQNVPSGLTTGEIKKDASDISDEDDLKKYDLCVAQTDKDKASSNFYLYCNQDAMDKITKNNSKIKITAKAYADESYGRVWKPSVVSQQKITFLEKSNVISAKDRITVTGDYHKGSFTLVKTDAYNPDKTVAGATYGLYEDSDLDELVCKLETGSDGTASTGNITLTEDTYYLAEIDEADGYQLDETVYKLSLKDFTLYDDSGKVTQSAKAYAVKDTPNEVGVQINKTDAFTKNVLTSAKFVVYDDEACTKRTKMSDGTDVPTFSYDSDFETAISDKFPKTQEKYYVKEIVPAGYVDNDTVWEVTPDYGDVEVKDIENTPIRCEVNAVKQDSEKGKAQGDASLIGAVYGLYAAEDIVYQDGSGVVTYTSENPITSSKGTDFTMFEVPATKGTLLATVKTDSNAEFQFGNLFYGDYYVKEIEPSEGYQLNETAYSVDFTKVDDVNHDITLNTTVTEDAKKQPFQLIKVSIDDESKEEEKLEGAEFTVKLLSEITRVGWDDAEVYDTLVTDKDGYAVSNPLPYGTYLVRETKTPDNVYTAEDFQVQITENSSEPQVWRVINDAPFKSYVRIVKKDKNTGKTVLLADTTFKIRNTDTNEFVSFKVGNKKVDTFTTDDTGMVTTPGKLRCGSYEAVEITAPDGFVLGDSEPFTIAYKTGMKVDLDEDGDPVFEVVIENEEVKGNVTVHKEGEVLSSSGVLSWAMSYPLGDGMAATEGLDFQYEKQSLAGAVYNLVVDETVFTADHQTDDNGDRIVAEYNGVKLEKDAVAATLVTNEEGMATATDLPLGKYHLEEVKAPEGFVLNTEKQEVSLEYEGQTVERVYHSADFINERQKTALKVVKKDSRTDEPVQGASYGLFAAEDILDASGNTAAASGSAIEVEITDENGEISFQSDLPLGSYYVKELVSPKGYLLDETVYPVDFTYHGQEMAVISETIETKDTPIVLQVSKTDITSGKELDGAKLEILDVDGNVFAEWTTDGTVHEINAMPAGEYVLRETAAPYGYRIAGEVEFTVEETGEIQKVEMQDERVKGKILINKTDEDTGKPIEGTEFEIRDADGKVLETLVTDAKGHAESQEMDICTYKKNGEYDKDIHYIVTETKAADGYVLDSTEHDVVIRYDDSATETVCYTLDLTNKKQSLSKLPQTGGNFNPWLWTGTGLALFMAGLLLRRKKKSSRLRKDN